MLQAFHALAQYLIALVTEKTVGGRADARAGRRLREGIFLAVFDLLVGLLLDGGDCDIEVNVGRETELFLEVGKFLDAG
jgi:hypothetical protein